MHNNTLNEIPVAQQLHYRHINIAKQVFINSSRLQLLPNLDLNVFPLADGFVVEIVVVALQVRSNLKKGHKKGNIIKTHSKNECINCNLCVLRSGAIESRSNKQEVHLFTLTL